MMDTIWKWISKCSSSRFISRRPWTFLVRAIFTRLFEIEIPAFNWNSSGKRGVTSYPEEETIIHKNLNFQSAEWERSAFEGNNMSMIIQFVTLHHLTWRENRCCRVCMEEMLPLMEPFLCLQQWADTSSWTKDLGWAQKTKMKTVWQTALHQTAKLFTYVSHSHIYIGSMCDGHTI